jgi:membrane-bound lytic murein transglycosylase D
MSLTLALGACANQPTTPGSAHANRHATAPASTTPAPFVAMIPAATPAEPPAPTDFWAQMQASFKMDDCDADPGIGNWAHTYTRRPDRFEAQLTDVLPLIEYAQTAAMKNNVAGEFALLPWIESQFQPVKGRKDRPAGMWQIVPSTARTLGLPVGKNYDGRLDTAASTDAVMKMLARYYDDLGDWRLVDMAFNAGEFGVRKSVEKNGRPPATPAIPRMPMKAVTREHLVKLLAVACVIRQPERYGVSLPRVDKTKSLQVVPMAAPQSLSQAAQQSSISVDRMRQLNPAHASTQSTVNATLLLPASAATVYREAAQSGATVTGPVASTVDTDAPAEVDKTPDKRAKGKHAGGTVKVGNGDSLWTIARAHSVTVKQLMTWNGLKTQKLKLGQVLRVSPK